ncbi:MAG: hypothetical protein KGI98_16175, partial [Euryarchaeota archaeon]|nr:hypothetical protein [Euryarchaeota archaeon]
MFLALLLTTSAPAAGPSTPPPHAANAHLRFFLNPQSCGGSVPLSNTTLVITNPTGAGATGTYDQSITVSWSGVSGVTTNLSNVEYTYPNGTSIESWIENNATSTGVNSTVWLKLNSIPSGSSADVQQLVCPSTVYEMIGGNGPTGAYPNSTVTYGKHDNGRLVFFEFYDNFSGVSYAAHWAVHLPTQNKGVHFAASASWTSGAYQLETTPTFGPGNESIFEGDAGIGATGGQPILGFWNGLAGGSRSESGMDLSGVKATACVTGNCGNGAVFSPTAGTMADYIDTWTIPALPTTYSNVTFGSAVVSQGSYAGSLS